MKGSISGRSRLALVAGSIAALGLGWVGCSAGGYAGGYYVDPVSAWYGPYWYPATYGTYTYVGIPWWGDPPPPPKNDPMRKDSPTHKAMVDEVHSAFRERGYRTANGDGDVDVAVYASSQPELDISGYTHIYNWKNLPKLRNQNKFPKGTVIVDVLEPKTHVLLWRGKTVAPVSDDVEKYKKDLRAAVDRIVAKYPKAGEKPKASKSKDK